MTHVLSSAQMKAIDTQAITDFGLPARLLMENAGKGCADYILQHFPEAVKGKVVILHGGGNNSGDGFVIARWLFMAGISVALFKVQDGKYSPESSINFELCQKLGIFCFNMCENKALDFVAMHLQTASMIIDAVFGIGFKGDLTPDLTRLFEIAKSCKARCVAIDIPSGLNADTGEGDDSFKAQDTLCIHSPKIGSLLHSGRFNSGSLHIIPIGIPKSYNEAVNPALIIDDTSHETPIRYHAAHKGMYGRVIVIGGSVGFLGSVALSSKAALRAGAGFVNLLSREELSLFYCTNPAELMFIPIPEDEDSCLPEEEELLLLLTKADSIVIGPGMGLDKYARELLELVLKTCSVPIIVDADALRLIAGNPKMHKYLKKPNILLTPHYGEFCALAKVTFPQIIADHNACLKAFVEKHKTRVLLKSDTTVYCDAQNMYFSTAGNDGLATGGSGDVLSGIIASFAAQGMELGRAAINASYLMGKTAERLALKRQTPSIIPTDTIENLFIL